ncbi:hypothetical protein DV738_g662, partial [Chaetothyriales sp. CBS 135597]
MSSALGPAVQSLTSSLALLRSATEILDSPDFPRLRRVLSTQQHFELLPEPQLRAAQQSVAGEIAPAISQLLATAEKYVDELGRRDAGLKASKAKLLRQKKERLQYAIDRLELQLKQRERELRRSMAFK